MAAEITASQLIAAACLIILTSISLRILYILPFTRPRHGKKTPRTGTAHLLIVLGSGGHTAEMLSIMRSINPNRYAPRTYLVSSGDDFSASKAAYFEATLRSKCESQFAERFEVFTVPRARMIHQPLYTTPMSSFQCLIACMRLLVVKKKGQVPELPRTSFETSPDLIITNGPATGVIVVLASLLVRFLGWQSGGEMKTVYVESWARVRSLSFSGKVLLWCGLTDRFLVQWEALKGRRAEWRGFLVE